MMQGVWQASRSKDILLEIQTLSECRWKHLKTRIGAYRRIYTT